jgi:hypothetical protein
VTLSTIDDEIMKHDVPDHFLISRESTAAPGASAGMRGRKPLAKRNEV